MNDTGQNSGKEFYISNHFRTAFIKNSIQRNSLKNSCGPGPSVPDSAQQKECQVFEIQFGPRYCMYNGLQFNRFHQKK